jgi:streptogramin lyase
VEVQRVVPSGKQVQVFTVPGFITGPAGVAVDSAGNVYVTDAQSEHVVKFSPTGTILKQWG